MKKWGSVQFFWHEPLVEPDKKSASPEALQELTLLIIRNYLWPEIDMSS
jgi:hypothetical protein